MLYGNALLSYAYLEAYKQTGRDFYRETAERTLNYVLRELTGPSGEFYCGQDADSDGEEGKYYLFTPDEITNVPGDENGKLFCRWYDITEQGNFEGKSIPNLLENTGCEHVPPKLSEARRNLSEYRFSRMRLYKDDKVPTSWNALMIAAFAKAFRVLGKAEYLKAAERARTFIDANLTAPDGRLLLRWRSGEAAHTGQLDDYAFYAWALLELYEAGFSVSHLTQAAELARQMHRYFWDVGYGGFFLTANDAERLIARPKEVYDGAMPSGNSAAGLVLSRLWKLTGDGNSPINSSPI